MTSAGETTKREQLEHALSDLLQTTSTEQAHATLTTMLPLPKEMSETQKIQWNYHAERARRQLVGAALGQLGLREGTQQLWKHLNTHGNVVMSSDEPHAYRSSSLKDFIHTMNHWFRDPTSAIMHDTTNSTARSIIDAYELRAPQFLSAVGDWVKLQQRRDPTFTWAAPARDIRQDIIGTYTANMNTIVPNQFIVMGLDTTGTGKSPAELAQSRLTDLHNFSSSVHPVSRQIFLPLTPPANAPSEKVSTMSLPQPLYSAWEHRPTPQTAAAFLELSNDPVIKKNLRLTGDVPGAGEDGRARNPGVCHADLRIIDEEAFAVPPRDLLRKLGQDALAETKHLNIATVVAGVGFNAAQHTLYRNWPTL